MHTLELGTYIRNKRQNISKCQLFCLDLTLLYLPKSSHHPCSYMRASIQSQPCEAKISDLANASIQLVKKQIYYRTFLKLCRTHHYLCFKVIIQQNIRGFYISVDYSWMACQGK
jgi:hypothetical protein